MFSRYRPLGVALLFVGRYDDSVQWLGRSLAANPDNNPSNLSDTYAFMAAAQALGGQIKEARLSAAEASRLAPTITARSFFPYIRNAAAVEQVAELLLEQAA